MINPTAHVGLAEHIVFRETNSSLCMLFDRDKGVMYELNETASQFVSLLRSGPRTIADLAAELGELYDGTLEVISSDTSTLVDELEQAGLLTVR